MTDDYLLAELKSLCEQRGIATYVNADTELIDIDFGSLEFLELASRVEEKLGHRLNFGSSGLRELKVVSDVVELLTLACE